MWDDETWLELATRAVRLARDAGALGILPLGLIYRAALHVHAGEFTAASDLIEESDAIAEAIGDAPLRHTSLVLAAWRGSEARALELIEAGAQEAAARGEGRAIGLARYATAVLCNGLGRYQDALASAQWACEYEDLAFFGWCLAEVVEAGVRCGAHGEAAAALPRLEERTRASGTDWALGILARSQALLSDGRAADLLYREAIERLERTRIAVHLARSHLVYGEWLRRENRRLDAREHLRTAYEMLHRFGANAFAERARRELLATGESVRQRAVEVGQILTAQEAQIARLAGDGKTNSQIGAELFLSPHRRMAPAQGVHQARRQLAEQAPRSPGRRLTVAESTRTRPPAGHTGRVNPDGSDPGWVRGPWNGFVDTAAPGAAGRFLIFKTALQSSVERRRVLSDPSARGRRSRHRDPYGALSTSRVPLPQ
jgi:tetratricopeptide (TPR) repeat protein